MVDPYFDTTKPIALTSSSDGDIDNDTPHLYGDLLHRPAELFKGRYVTPYINTRRIIDRHVESDLVDDPSFFRDDPRAIAPLIPIPKSIKRSCFELQKCRYQRMLEKVYGKLKAPPHRLSPKQRDLFSILRRGQSTGERQGEDSRALANLYVTLPQEHPYYDLGAPSYTTYRMRELEKWVNSRQREDQIVLFGNEVTDKCFQRQYKEHRSEKLERWKEIDQGRYFWDFIDGYFDRKEERIEYEGMDLDEIEPKERKGMTTASFGGYGDNEFGGPTEYGVNKIISRRSTSMRFSDLLALSPRSKSEFKYLPSIYPFEPPQFRRKLIRERIVKLSRLLAFGKQVDRLCSFAPIQIDMNRWLRGTLSPNPEFQSRTTEIMSYFSDQLQLKYPATMKKTFEDLYPSLPQEKLKQLREEARSKQTAAKKGETVTDLVPTEKREVRKVAGGRYTVR